MGLWIALALIGILAIFVTGGLTIGFFWLMGALLGRAFREVFEGIFDVPNL